MDTAFFNGRLSTEAWLFLTVVYVTLNTYKNWKILNQLDFNKSEWYYLTIEVLFSSCSLHISIAVINFTSNIVLYFMFSFVRIFFYIFDFFLISNSLSFSVTSLLPILLVSSKFNFSHNYVQISHWDDIFAYSLT